MANFYLNLPAPSANGAGAWVATNSLGYERTIVIGDDVRATINIEVSNQLIGSGDGAPLTTFVCPGECQRTVFVGASWMRAVVSDYKSGTPNIQVGGEDTGITRVNLPVTAADGIGAAVDVSLVGSVQKTAVVMGAYRGTVILELSEDNVTWAEGPVFIGGPQYQNFAATAKFLRVRRAGVPTIAPGTPIVNIAIINDVLPPASFTNPELVRYTAAAAGTSSFTVTLATVRANADYFVDFMSQSIVAASGISKTVVSIPRATRTVSDFVVNVSAPVEAGDQFEFLVVG
jgi:hypothetical protein